MGTAVGNGVALGSDVKFGLGVDVGIGSGVGIERSVGVGCEMGVEEAPGVDFAGSDGESHTDSSIDAKTHNNPIPTTGLRGLRMLTISLEPDISCDALYLPQPLWTWECHSS